MKTFKLKGLSVIWMEDSNLSRELIPLTDGLIINKEDEQENWLVEGLIPNESAEFFESLATLEQPFVIEAVITKESNTPAPFSATIRKLKAFEDHLEILLDAKMIVKKQDAAELLLQELIEEGLVGQELFQEFKRIKTDRGRSYQGAIEKEVEKMKSNL
ncbi:YwpF-like family protein [Bacillus tianshenii]|nr:YwpF-like family protein [Bacillus tianshenii]